jgi:phage gp29-like protein
MAGSQVVLYDATGTQVPLPGAPTPPTSSGIPEGIDQTYRDRFRGYPSRNLTPAKIINILQNADAGWPLEWIELCEEIVEKDPKIGSVLHTRTAAVLGLYYEIQPPKLDDIDTTEDPQAQEIARFCDQALLASNFTDLVGDLLDAVGKPFAVDWVDWKLNRDGKVVPQRFRRIPTKHIHWSFDSDTIRVYDPYAQVAGVGGNLGLPLPPYTTVRAVYNTRHDHPTRAGLLRSLVWYYLFKITGLKDLVAYSDRYGMPLRVLFLDDADYKNPAIYNEMRASLAHMGTDASGVLSKNSVLQIEKMAEAGGAGVFKELIDYMDKAIAQLVLGHELSSQGSAGGGLLGISAALQVRQDILEADCNFISSTIKRDVLTPLVGWNFGWDAVEQGLVPNLTYNYEPPKDLVAQANVMSVVAATFPDLPFSKQQIRDEYGFDEPLGEDTNPLNQSPEDDVLMPGGIVSDQAAGIKAPKSPDPARGTPEVSINSLASRRMKRRRMPSKYSPARQKAVDRLAKKGIKTGHDVAASWGSQLRQLLRDSAAEGVSLLDVRNRIVKAYPDLDAAALEQTLREQMVLVRLFGRQS